VLERRCKIDFMGKIVILSGQRAGDRQQLLDVARATGLPWEEFRLKVRKAPNAWQALWPQHHAEPDVTDMLMSLKAADVVLVAENVACNLAARAKRMKAPFALVCVGRPRGRFASYDLILSSPHYMLAGMRNVVELDYPPHNIVGDPDGLARSNSNIPKGALVCLVGGAAGTHYFSTPEARQLGRQLLHRAGRGDVPVRAVLSPRTPDEVRSGLEGVFAGHNARVLPWHAGSRGDYVTALAQAGELVVTADSVSMLVEAMLSGKPTSTYPLPIRSTLQDRFVRWIWQSGRLRKAFDLGLLEQKADKQRLIERLLARDLVGTFGKDSVWKSGAALPTVSEASDHVVALLSRREAQLSEFQNGFKPLDSA
jgi:uncharacterized protein